MKGREGGMVCLWNPLEGSRKKRRTERAGGDRETETERGEVSLFAGVGRVAPHRPAHAGRGEKVLSPLSVILTRQTPLVIAGLVFFFPDKPPLRSFIHRLLGGL